MPWFEETQPKLPRSSNTAEAIRYTLNHWEGLVRFLEDGRISTRRSSTLGRPWLFRKNGRSRSRQPIQVAHLDLLAEPEPDRGDHINGS